MWKSDDPLILGRRPAYLQCFYSALTSKCPGYGGGKSRPFPCGWMIYTWLTPQLCALPDDFAYYQVSWFSSMCGSVPATAMAQIKAPSTVELSLRYLPNYLFVSRHHLPYLVYLVVATYRLPRY